MVCESLGYKLLCYEQFFDFSFLSLVGLEKSKSEKSVLRHKVGI